MNQDDREARRVERSDSELARKALHIAMGGFAFCLAYLTWWQAALCAAAAVVNNAVVLPRFGRRLFRGRAAQHGLDAGIMLYPASVLALVLLFPRRLEIAAAGWAFLAFGDGLATVAGLTLGRVTGPVPWNARKSWAGLLGFLLCGTPAAVILYGWVLGRVPAPAVFAGIVATGVVIAVVETLPLRISDNVTVPLGAGGLLYAATLVDPARLAAGADVFLARLPWALAVNAAVGLTAYGVGTVDWSGLAHGIALGTAIWVFGGGASFAVLVLFFALGVAATRIGRGTKVREGTAQENEGRRGAKHAWANAGLAALFCFLAAATAHGDAFRLGAVAALATATFDTLSSEIGQAYGRRTFLLTTLRSARRGTPGAVSLEGTLAGFTGALALGAAGFGLGLIGGRGVIWVALGAFVGATLESVLGALLERKDLIDSEAKNFLNTLVGGLTAVGLWRLAR